jgi:membrane-bound lytic murein transglycosylase B
MTAAVRAAKLRAMKRSLSALFVSTLVASCAFAREVPATAETHPGQREFARELAAEASSKRPGLTEDRINQILDDAKKQPGIIAAMTRPAEAKPWRDYRPIFMTEARIAQGAAFWREHAELLEPIAAEYGVPPEMIVAIIGVETSYGRITGTWRAVDALATLAFHYPPRAPYFRGELKRLLLLPEGTFPMPLGEIRGSYAGAMGLPQFMPTSYATWAVDHDGDGRIDLWNSDADIFASVAKYFIDHGWEPGAAVTDRATAAAGAVEPTRDGFRPVSNVGALAEAGFTLAVDRDAATPATLVQLEGAAGPEHWVTYQNFFVITRYNRSPLYAMAVHQLSQAIAERHRAGSASP